MSQSANTSLPKPTLAALARLVIGVGAAAALLGWVLPLVTRTTWREIIASSRFRRGDGGHPAGKLHEYGTDAAKVNAACPLGPSHDRRGLAGLLDKAEQLAMDRLVAGGDL